MKQLLNHFYFFVKNKLGYKLKILDADFDNAATEFLFQFINNFGKFIVFTVQIFK